MLRRCRGKTGQYRKPICPKVPPFDLSRPPLASMSLQNRAMNPIAKVELIAYSARSMLDSCDNPSRHA